MKSIQLIVLLLIVKSGFSQPSCGFEEIAYNQLADVTTFIVSDENQTNTSEFQIVYDDFELSESKTINGICVRVAFQDTRPTIRDQENTRSLPVCSPASLDVKYYSDDESEPGTVMASFEEITDFTTPDQFGLITINHPPVPFGPGNYWLSINSNGDEECRLLIGIDGGNNEDESIVNRTEVNTREVTTGVLTSDSSNNGFTQEGGGDGMYFFLRAGAPIPTMGEWGIIILGLSLIIFGIVAVKRRVISL